MSRLSYVPITLVLLFVLLVSVSPQPAMAKDFPLSLEHSAAQHALAPDAAPLRFAARVNATVGQAD
jgi:hypothetical protein